MRGGEVEQGPPAEDAAERGFAEVKVGGRGDRERQPGVETPGVGDHAWGEVDAGDLEAKTVEMGRDRSRAAADVQDRSPAADVVGERRQRRTLPRRRIQLTDAHRDVVVGHSVIRRPDELQIGGLRSGSGHSDGR
jgi:hypothetical protein